MFHTISEAKKPEKIDRQTQYEIQQTLSQDIYESLYTFIQKYIDTKKNSVFSPVTLYLTLLEVSSMTDGSTRQEILDTLQCKDRKEISDSLYKVLSTPNCTLSNGCWINEDYHYHKSLLKELSHTHYLSSYKEKMGEKTDKRIFSWIKENTHGLMKESTIKTDTLTYLLLINLLYMKVKWMTPFDKDNNTEGLFNHKETVTYMNQTDFYGYHVSSDFEAVTLPLENGYFMTCVKPVESIENVLHSDDFKTFLINGSLPTSQRQALQLSIPRFTSQDSIDLVKTLSDIGISSIFNETGDFTPLTNECIYVSKAFQSSTVIVNETGIEASSKVEIEMSVKGAYLEPQPFILDVPFLYVIHRFEKLPLFVGSVIEIGENHGIL